MKIQHYTTEEQSRQLIKAGLDVNTADMWAERNFSSDISVKWNTARFLPLLKKQSELDDRDKFFVVNKQKLFKAILPCWSLSALINIIKQNIRLIHKYDDFAIIFSGEKCRVTYRGWWDDTVKGKTTSEADSELEAVYNVMLSLLKIKHLKSLN